MSKIFIALLQIMYNYVYSIICLTLITGAEKITFYTVCAPDSLILNQYEQGSYRSLKNKIQRLLQTKNKVPSHKIIFLIKIFFLKY